MELQKPEMKREIKMKMGAIIRTRLTGTIHCWFCDPWNRTAHQTIKNPPETLAKTKTRHAHTALGSVFFFPFLSPSSLGSVSAPACISLVWDKEKEEEKLTNDPLEEEDGLQRETPIILASFNEKGLCSAVLCLRMLERERK